jgi:hypothetical protein
MTKELPIFAIFRLGIEFFIGFSLTIDDDTSFLAFVEFCGDNASGSLEDF